MSIKKPPFLKYTKDIKKITETKLSHKILWDYFHHFVRYISWQGKLFPNDLMAYFGLCKFLNNLSVLCFVTNLLGHPLCSVFIFHLHLPSSSSIFIFCLHLPSSSSVYVFHLRLPASSSIFILCHHLLSSSSNINLLWYNKAYLVFNLIDFL